MSTPTMQGQVALVTGATRGIGSAIAHELAARGMKVVGTATTDEGAARITEALSQYAACRGAQLDVNLRGAFLCTKAALRGMIRRRWGRIINVSSVVGLMGNAGQANYAAAKAGLLGLTRATAREVASRGITVNAIAPGFVETDMTASLNAAQREAVLREVPLERFALPAEIAPAVVFLASDAAGYITGQVLSIDGGMVMA